jgi:hypothetical protein
MPAPLKEYLCAAHGAFESRAKSPRCPYGCNTVERRFYTAPAIRTGPMMTGLDRLQGRIAAELGLSDLRSDAREGSTVMGSLRADQKGWKDLAQGQAPMTSYWGNPSNFGGFPGMPAVPAKTAAEEQGGITPVSPQRLGAALPRPLVKPIAPPPAVTQAEIQKVKSAGPQ